MGVQRTQRNRENPGTQVSRHLLVERLARIKAANNGRKQLKNGGPELVEVMPQPSPRFATRPSLVRMAMAKIALIGKAKNAKGRKRA